MSETCHYCGATPDDWCPKCGRFLCPDHTRSHMWQESGRCYDRKNPPLAGPGRSSCPYRYGYTPAEDQSEEARLHRANECDCVDIP